MSKREELESKIREKRVLEANKKGFVGFSGKIGTVLKMLGSEVVQQDFPWEEYEDDEKRPRNPSEFMSSIPTLDVEGNSRPETMEWSEVGKSYYSQARVTGFHFDGLSRGMHMEIKCDEEMSELCLTYKGYVAYKEIMGEIESYVPNEEWENWIEKLWNVARKMQRKQKEAEFKKEAETKNIEKQEWWRSLIKKWGNI